MSPAAKKPLRSAARKVKGTPAPYHHGNLREALLEAGLALLREHGAESLGLRELARQAGVSRTAPYRHFESKEDLIAAIAEQGFLRLQAYQDEARRRHPDDVEAWFLEGARQYIRFAVHHPEHLKVMFGPRVTFDSARQDHPLHAAGDATFGKLVELVVTAQKAGLVRAGDPVAVSVSVWSLLHGFAMLLVHNRLNFLHLEPARLAALTEQAAHDALAAVRAPPAAAPGPTRRAPSR
jgi:AcrR family transcriptional regulator